MSGLDAGLMTAEIVLQTAPAVQSDSGEQTWDWDHVVAQDLFAQWLPGGTRETWQAQQRLGSYVDGVFRIYDLDTRLRPDNTRIVFDGRIFDTKPYVEIYDGGMVVGLDIPVVARGE